MTDAERNEKLGAAVRAMPENWELRRTTDGEWYVLVRLCGTQSKGAFTDYFDTPEEALAAAREVEG